MNMSALVWLYTTCWSLILLLSPCCWAWTPVPSVSSSVGFVATTSTIRTSTFLFKSTSAAPSASSKPKIPTYRQPRHASRNTLLKSLYSDDSESSSETTAVNQQSRRVFGKRLKDALISSLPLFLGLLPHPPSANAHEESATIDKAMLRGIVTLADGLAWEPTASSALYVTVRPNQADNIPRAILDGSNGKPPPILVARIPNPTSFPFEFTLSAPRDLTGEGAAIVDSNNNNGNIDGGSYWFEGLDWIISARWDTDGVAATRDPTDLVGRTIQTASSRRSSNDEPIRLQLQGRGFAGKLVTGKKKS